MKLSSLAAFTVVTGLAASANADVIYNWAVVAGSSTLNPGESVTLGLFATHDGLFYAGGKFTVRIDGFTDGAAFAEEKPTDTHTNFLGRRPNGNGFIYFRNFPAELSYSMNGNIFVGNTPDDAIDHFTMIPIFNDFTDHALHIEFFRMTYTAGSTPGVRTIATQFTQSLVATLPIGIPTEQPFTDASIEINVIPAPTSLALISLASLLASRRRR